MRALGGFGALMAACALAVDGTVIRNNTAREGGGAIFFVSDNFTGTLRIEDSRLRDNPSEGFATAGYPGIFFHSAAAPIVAGSTLTG